MNCYNCSKGLRPQDRHREHIPADNLFAGFPNEYKNNRITVDACFECNQSYSGVDEEFRNLIGLINKHPIARELTEKTIRSVLRNKSKLARVIYNHRTNKTIAMSYNKEDIAKFHIKNFKGLFYHSYGYPVPNNYRIKAHFDKNFKSEQSQRLVNYLTSNFQWKISGHEDVFRYILQPFRQNYPFDNNDIQPANDEKYFLSIQSYTKNHAVLVLAEFLE